MGSGTRFDPAMGRAAPSLIDLDKLARLGLSPRQQELNRLWAWYRCASYDARRCDWDGKERLDPIETESVARAGYVPPGFYTAAVLPLKFRRPTAPYNLCKVVVDRFTGLLFSERRHPQVRVDGDQDTEGTVAAIVEAARLWPAMIQARTYGGATGSACMGFQFMDGKPVVEVHDPRWVMPKFADRASLRVTELDKRYMYPADERDPATGVWVQVWYWYRRLITETHDVLWKPIVVGDGQEPNWDDDSLVEAYVEHDFGFCPAVWIQNVPCSDDVDGDPDCLGIFDMVESIDALIAQANRGTLSNCDPTVVITSQDDMSELVKGSDNAIKLATGDAKYLEISGLGPKAAREMAQELRQYALEVAQCVLEQPNGGGLKTATEIERTYSSMFSKADIFREQYGERGIKPIIEMMLKAARIVTKPKAVNGSIERGMLVLPDKVTQNPDGTVTRTPRKLGPGGVIRLQWGGYAELSLGEVTSAVQAASAAKAGGLVDAEHASKLVAEHFRVEDVPAMLAKVKEEQAERVDVFAKAGLQALGDDTRPPMTPRVPRLPVAPETKMERAEDQAEQGTRPPPQQE